MMVSKSVCLVDHKHGDGAVWRWLGYAHCMTACNPKDIRAKSLDSCSDMEGTSPRGEPTDVLQTDQTAKGHW